MADISLMSERDVVRAIEKLNRSTSRLAIVNIVLTAVILMLTGLQLWSFLAK